MYQFLLVSIVIISCLLIFLVLMQQGKGADAGAAFGSGAGASGTVFGAQGAGNFLTRMTAVLATLFFVACLALSWLIANKNAGNLEEESIIDRALQEGVIQDLPGASNTIVPGSDLPAAGIALEASDLPTAASVTVDATAGEAITVDMPVMNTNIDGVSVETVVGEQADAVTGTITEGLEALTDQAQELITQPELDLPELPAVE